ncbi:hypothetical protein CK203_023158 [Vitis vinifera]|uniref:DUF4283 domain-containing protein n=1 Tax=Vitis vinifera TaxID=29760 RepID=A0A438J1P8_VITVI|nr:hypothetical protein CK203_023158 [Vitis vinifera]
MGERERERARERESGGDEGGEGATKRRKRERKSFVVESKTFEINLEEKRGKIQVEIWEMKKGISSWVRLGLASLGFLSEGLEYCIKDGKGGKWERGWKENGRSYSLVRGENKGGLYLRLEVVDLEKKRHSIIVPKGRGEKGGWVTMAEKIQQMGGFSGRKEQKQKEWCGGKLGMEVSYAEVVKKQKNRDRKLVRMEVRKEEVQNNLRKLEHCIIGSWDPCSAGGEDLESLGQTMSKVWGLKGNLGLARMEKNRVLLEFEILGEAIRVMSTGNRSFDGAHLRLERWNPRIGCSEEVEITNEVWVRIVGLPLSLWNKTILRRVGEECGGFIAMDPRTEKMQELQWARILIRTNGEDLPSRLEISVEEKVYALALWWELKPSLKKAQENRSEVTQSTRGEVRGDGASRAVTRVGKEVEGTQLEALLLPEKMMGIQEGEVGRVIEKWDQGGSGARSTQDAVDFGPQSAGPDLGPKGMKRVGGPYNQGATMGLNLKLKGVVGVLAGQEAGPSKTWWTTEEESPSCDGGMDLEESPSKPLLQDTNKDQQLKVCSPASPLVNNESNMEEEVLKNWETEDLRKRNTKFLHSATDSTLIEEAMRYGSVLLLRGERVPGSSHLISFSLDRAPEGGHYDRSGNAGVEPQFEVPLCVVPSEGSEENVIGCWALVENNGGSTMYRDEEWGPGLNDPQAERGEKEERWEESSLAKFSHFLGFSTEGLEKEILDFLIKIRKRRERIHDKVLLEKSKFERELKRLECSVNYEKGRKQKDPPKGKGCHLSVLQ